MKDSSIFSHISALIEEEKQIRVQPSASPEASARLRHLNEELDQCWDLLRQHRRKVQRLARSTRSFML